VASQEATTSTLGSISAKTRSKSSRGRPIGSTMSSCGEFGSIRPRPAMTSGSGPRSDSVTNSVRVKTRFQRGRHLLGGGPVCAAHAQHQIGRGEHRRTQVPGLESARVITAFGEHGRGVRMDRLTVQGAHASTRGGHLQRLPLGTHPVDEPGQHPLADRRATDVARAHEQDRHPR